MFLILTLIIGCLIFIFFKYFLQESKHINPTLLHQDEFKLYKLNSIVYCSVSIIFYSFIFTFLFNFIFSLQEDNEALAIIGRIEHSNINPTALLFSFFLSFITVQYLLKQKLKNQLSYFYEYLERQYPIKINAKLIVSSGILLFGLSTIASYKLLIENHINFHKNKLTVIRWYELTGSDYNYDDINDVKFFEYQIAPNGNTVLRPYFIFNFKDDSSFNSSSITISITDLSIIENLLKSKKIPVHILKPE